MKAPELLHRFLSRLRAASSRAGIILFLLTTIIWALMVPSILLERHTRTELDSLRRKRADLYALSREYLHWRDRLREMEERLSLVPSGGIGAALDGVVSSLGLRSKLRSLKVMGSRAVSTDWEQEIVMLEIDKLTLNELINLLYQLKEDNAFLLKRATIRKEWENPEHLQVTLTVGLVTKKQ